MEMLHPQIHRQMQDCGNFSQWRGWFEFLLCLEILLLRPDFSQWREWFEFLLHLGILLLRLVVLLVLLIELWKNLKKKKRMIQTA